MEYVSYNMQTKLSTQYVVNALANNGLLMGLTITLEVLVLLLCVRKIRNSHIQSGWVVIATDS